MFHILFQFLSIISLLTASEFSQASFSSPPKDNNYYIQEYPSHRLIFDQQYLPYLDELNEKIRYYIEKSNEIQLRPIDPNFTVVLGSSKVQNSNAIATIHPFLHLKIFSTGVETLGPLASHLWFDFTFIHELNHLFQLDYSIFPKSLKIKQPLLGFLFPPYPNFLLPLLFTEGDAVFKESLWGVGGRMYSGEVRALVYSQIKHYKDHPKKLARKLINNQIHPHDRSMKYFHGGYLFTALSHTFSHHKINEFFKNNGGHFIPLLTFNRALKKTFQMNIQSLIKFYISTFKSEASRQQSIQAPSLFESATCKEINRHQDQIFFLTSNLRSTPKLRTYNTRLKTWNTQRIDLPLGKLFFLKNKYYSRSSQRINPYETVYSLYSSGAYPHPHIHSQFVQDIFKTDILSIDTTNNIRNYNLLLNDKFYDNTHSNALFDSQKNIYYFKQNKNKRILYRNKKPVFSYSGYYGKLVDIRPDGSVFFIASTPYGSSVYKYLDGQVTRSLVSDTVRQAKTISDQEIIICEVTPDGYVYKITQIEELADTPVIYKYPFETIPHFEASKTPQFKKHTLTSPPASKTTEDKSHQIKSSEIQEILNDLSRSSNRSLNSEEEEEMDFLLTSKKLKIKKYSPIKNLKLSQWVPILFSINSLWNIQGFYWKSLLLFKDDLSKNTIALSVGSHAFARYQASMNYQNNTHAIQWILGYELDFLLQNDSKYDAFKKKYPLHSHKTHWTGFYSLFRKGRWRSSILSEKSLSFSEVYTTHYFVVDLLSKKLSVHESVQYFFWDWKPSLFLTYNKSYSLNTFSNKHFEFRFSPHYKHHLIAEQDVHIPVFNTEFRFFSSLHLGYEFYIQPQITYLEAWTQKTGLFNEQLFPVWQDMTDIYVAADLPYIGRIKNFKYPLEISGKRVVSIGSNILKSIYTPIYSSTLPLSLRRMIPSFRFNYWLVDQPRARQDKLVAKLSKVNRLHILEFQIVLDLELLIYFESPVRLRLLMGGSHPINAFVPPQSYAQMSFQSKF